MLDKHRDFHVRREKVVNALRFFKLNNPYYADVEIDTEQISQLPVNGRIHAQIQTVEIPENTESVEEESKQIYESIVPHKIKISEADRIQSELDNVVPWPQATNIVNEFTCEGYVTMAFPALLPFGKSELNDNTGANNMKLTALEYFQFLMQYKDQRFARDP